MFPKLRQLLKSLHDCLDSAQLALPDERWEKNWKDVYWSAVRELKTIEDKEKERITANASKGGKACAAKLSPEERKARASKAGLKRWEPFRVGDRIEIVKLGTEARGPFRGKPNDHCKVGMQATVVSVGGDKPKSLVCALAMTAGKEPIYFSQSDRRYFKRIA
jgi:hypothetical protein